MPVAAILAISTFLQFTTAFLAIRLLRVTRRHSAWILIAGALILMGTRRTITLYDVVSGSRPTRLDDTAEIIALVISILMLAGVHQIGATFRRMKETEKALGEREENFREFFESIDDVVLVAAPDGTLLHANKAAESKLGLVGEEFRQTPVLGFFHSERGADAESIFSATLAGTSGSYPLSLVGAGGAVIPAETRAWRGRWSGAECLYFVSKDLTVEAEAKQRFERLFRHNPCPMAVSSIPDGKFLDVNESFVLATGFSFEDVAGKTPVETGLLVDPGEFVSAAQSLLNEGRMTSREILVRRKDGRVVVGLFSGELIMDQGRQYFLTVMIDVTGHKVQEEALKASEERNRAIVSAIPDLLFRFDREGRFLDCQASNPNELLIPPAQGIGRLVREILPPELAEIPERKIVEVLSGRGVQVYEYDMPVRSQDRRFEARMVPYGADEVLAIVRDVTELRRVEEERLEMQRRLQQTQKLESLGVLAGGIAHDFNNLLMVILGHADLALEELSSTSPARENIEGIEVASRRAAELCRQMLAYSGKSSFVIAPFNLGVLIQEMAHLLGTSISKKAVLNLRTNTPLPKVKGDATQIRQVIMNLVINASEAIGERSGYINVSTGAVYGDSKVLQEASYSEGELQERLYVFVEVADTGCGMDQQTLDRLFEPFFTTKFMGRGLGMSAVLGIVRGHHGALTVQSEVGKGTTFRIYLPAKEAPEEDAPRCASSHFAGHQGIVRVLLVDDEESIRSLGSRMLERIGFRVITASDGREALKVYLQHRSEINVVLMDLTMPHMDGVEAARELKRLDPDARIVLSSGYSDQEVKARSVGQEVLGFIQKPYTMSALKECLFPLLEKMQPGTRSQE